MAVIIYNISKASGVLFLTEGTQNPKSYFGATGGYQFSDDSKIVSVRIGTDSFTARWEYILVNGQTPSTIPESKTLLNSIFGT